MKNDNGIFIKSKWALNQLSLLNNLDQEQVSRLIFNFLERSFYLRKIDKDFINPCGDGKIDYSIRSIIEEEGLNEYEMYLSIFNKNDDKEGLDLLKEIEFDYDDFDNVEPAAYECPDLSGQGNTFGTFILRL